MIKSDSFCNMWTFDMKILTEFCDSLNLSWPTSDSVVSKIRNLILDMVTLYL